MPLDFSELTQHSSVQTNVDNVEFDVGQSEGVMLTLPYDESSHVRYFERDENGRSIPINGYMPNAVIAEHIVSAGSSLIFQIPMGVEHLDALENDNEKTDDMDFSL